MPVPSLTTYGVLPPGIHECTLEEVEAEFAYRPPQPQRAELWTLFSSYVTEVRKTGLAVAIYVNGSFTTDANRAKDIDVVLELTPPTPAARAMAKGPLFNAKYAMDNFKVHLFLSPAWIPGGSDFREWFQTPNPKDGVARGLKPNARKGLIRVAL